MYNESCGYVAMDCECVLTKETHALSYYGHMGFSRVKPEPYTNAQMKSLVGKVLTNEDGSCHQLVHTYLDDGSILVGNTNKYYADGIMGCSVNGVPTCNFKHLENGKWAK